MFSYTHDKIIGRGFDKSSFDFQQGSVMLVDKPLEWTSFDVVNKIRHKLKYSFGYKKIKVGHAGTLDPLATGLLIVCTGKYTKIIDSIQGQEKVYSGKIILGGTTPTYDSEAEVDAEYPTEHITQELIEVARLSFIGEQMQIPPIFSAIKIKGESAYTLARRGEEVQMKARKVIIKELSIGSLMNNELSFLVTCSKGTYIRSLAHDFGKKLESGGYLGALRREKIGDFEVGNALKIDEIINLIDSLTR
jgi:tRNA pseudouridine55 synthase